MILFPKMVSGNKQMLPSLCAFSIDLLNSNTYNFIVDNNNNKQ